MQKNNDSIKKAKVLLNKLSFDEKIAQLVGYNPAHWSNDNLEKDYKFGVGQVSLLVGTEKNSIEEVAEFQKNLQKKIMSLSPHNIPALFHVETLTGLKLPGATSFPTGIGQAATFNPIHQKEVGRVIRKQAKAVGANLAFSPVLDISRDSRFGRQGETYGEDATLASSMGVSLIQGIQEDNQVASVAKHFIGYQGAEGGIHAANSEITERSLQEVYAKPFQAAVTLGNLKGIMPCYSAINLEPVTGSRKILNDFLRNDMHFSGITMSDYGAIREIYERHHVEESLAMAGRRALLAGVDQELPSKQCYSSEYLKNWMDDKKFMDKIDESVLRVLTLKFELGLFENPFGIDVEKLQAIFSSEENSRIALKSAQESLVLIKNNGTLPLKRANQKIAVIGCHANSIRSLFGGYSYMSTIEKHFGVRNTMAGVLTDYKSETIDFYKGSLVEREHPDVEKFARSVTPNTKSLYAEMVSLTPENNITYSYGYPYVGNDCQYHDEAIKLAKNADIIVLTVGDKYGTGSTASSGEGIDSTNINLPLCQEIFIEKVSKLGKPIVIVHFGGRPISSDAADKYASSILEAWNPGENGGIAIANVLFGLYNPSGKLPVTTAFNAGQIPIYYNHLNGSSYHQNNGGAFEGYMDCTHEPRYYFGHGLSYTTFEYRNLRIKNNLKDFEVILDIQNKGKVFGEEVIQVYCRDRQASIVRPNMELMGFYKIQLDSGQVKTVKFIVDYSQLAFLDENMKWKIEAGDIDIYVGSSSKDIRLIGELKIVNNEYIDGWARSFFSQVEEINI